MSDWQVGDLALCAAGKGCGDCWENGPHPLDGRTLTVIGVDDWGESHPALTFAEAERLNWCACQFRKIRPDEHEACEPEFVKLLKRKRVSA